MRPEPPPSGDGSVQFQPRWLLLLLSIVVLVLLRNDRLALSLYVGTVALGSLSWLVVVPRRLAFAERRFQREALRCLAKGDFALLDALAGR